MIGTKHIHGSVVSFAITYLYVCVCVCNNNIGYKYVTYFYQTV